MLKRERTFAYSVFGYSAPLAISVADTEIENDEGWTSTLVNLEIDLASDSEAERFVWEHQTLCGARLERPDGGTFVRCTAVNHLGLIAELTHELNGRGVLFPVEIDDSRWSPPEQGT